MFKKKIGSEEVKTMENTWLNHKLKFLVDGERAYALFKNKEKVKQYNRENDDFSIEDTRQQDRDTDKN